MAVAPHRSGWRGRLSRVGLRVRMAVAIAGISALVSVVSGFVVLDRMSAARYDQARESAVQRAQALAVEVAAGRTALPSGVSVERGGSDPIGALYPTMHYLASRHHSGSVITSDQSSVIGMAPIRGGGTLYTVTSLRFVNSALDDLRKVLIAVGLAAVVAGALLGLLAASLLIRPIQRAAGLARRIAGGDLEARLAPDGTDEIAQLGHALDDMAQALGERIDELDRAAERERQFSADVAHELRTPLAGIVAAADLLDDSDAARTVRRRAGDLMRLVGELLEVMRLDGTGEQPESSAFDLAALVRDAARERAPGASVQAPASLVVASDARRVERVVGNLLDNAVQHGAAPISVEIGGGSIRVRDAGPGFGAFLPRAGERFATASASRGSGFGLGLAIARGQAHVLGGWLELADDRGAVATLHLPASALDVPREALV